jgi:hypothetical protein
MAYEVETSDKARGKQPVASSMAEDASAERRLAESGDDSEDSDFEERTQLVVAHPAYASCGAASALTLGRESDALLPTGPTATGPILPQDAMPSSGGAQARGWVEWEAEAEAVAALTAELQSDEMLMAVSGGPYAFGEPPAWLIAAAAEGCCSLAEVAARGRPEQQVFLVRSSAVHLSALRSALPSHTRSHISCGWGVCGCTQLPISLFEVAHRKRRA